MEFLLDGLRQAWDLLRSGDPQLLEITGTTFKLAFVSTLLALIGGLPVGLALGLGRFRSRRSLLSVANAGMGLPPVVIGLIVALLLFRGAPLGELELLYTLNGVIVAQTLLALPLVIALTAASAQAVPGALLDQARAFGASRRQVATLTLREARVGVMAAAIAAMGSAFSEVGAVVLVGGNIDGETQTLASAVLVRVSSGEYGRAIALGTILLGIILVLSAILTVVQQRNRMPLMSRSS